VRYCGIVAAGPYQQLCTLEEVRTDEPPIRLHATFYDPGTPEQVAAELGTIADAVIAVGMPAGPPHPGRQVRLADEELRRRGVFPQPQDEGGRRIFAALAGRGVFRGDAADPEAIEGVVPEGAYATTPVFETSPDGVFCALQGRRLPARRHPLGIQMRIEELLDEHVEDEAELWHRRIEELDAAAAALAAHRFAVGHACWVGDQAEGVVVLPGSRLPDSFPGEGVIPPVPRLPLPRLG
jgi:predicted nuclease with RNAse H fold